MMMMMTSICISGTTWLQEITYLLYNNGDTEKAKSKFLYQRFPFVEATLPLTSAEDNPQPHLPYILQMGHPRLLKTHMYSKFFAKALQLCGDGAKVIVPIRNPKDTLVSFFHFHHINPVMGEFPGTFAQFIDSMFVRKKLMFGDYFDFYESWWEFKRANPDQVLFVNYEDMQRDIAKSIKEIAQFLGKPLSEDKLADVISHTSFGSMKNNNMVCPSPSGDGPRDLFFRKGKIGDWKNYFSVAHSELVDRLVKERFDPIGLTIKYE